MFLLFGAVYGVKIVLNGQGIPPMAAVSMTWCTAGRFVCGVLLVLMKLKLRSPVLCRLGDISLEIYLCHYLFL